MRQYNPGRQLIATAMLIGMTWLLPGNHLHAEPTVNSLALLQHKANEQFLQQVRPPVQPFRLQMQDVHATATLELKPGYDKSTVELVFAVPAVDITSAVVLMTNDDPSDVSPSLVNVRLDPMGYIRGNRIARLYLSASAFQQGHAVLSLKFASPVGTASRIRATGGPVDKMLRELVANPDDLSVLSIPLSSVPMPKDDGAPPVGNAATGAVAWFDVESAGFYEFTASDLTSAGIDLQNLPRQNVAVWSNGQPQSVWAIRDGGSLTDPVASGDRFVIYAQGNDSIFTTKRRYWIRTDVQAQPMARRSLTNASPVDSKEQWFMATEVIEQDVPPVLTKNDQFLSILDHRWVWWTWTTRGTDSNLPLPRDFNSSGVVHFNLPDLASAQANTSITLDFYSHHWTPETAPVPFEILVNGTSVGEAVVSSAEGLEHTVTVPAGILKTQDNELEIWPVATAPAASLPDICFDRMTIAFPRTLAVTSPTLAFTKLEGDGGSIEMDLPEGGFVADLTGDQPVLVGVQTSAVDSLPIPTPQADQRFLAVRPDGVIPAPLQAYALETDLYDSSNRADLVVIAWPEFISLLQPWVEAKTADGYMTRVVSVLDIYDQFGYGHLSPHAIRAFLRHASIHWQPGNQGAAVSSILLVGDSTSAYRNEFRNDVINYVPTMRLEGATDLFASDQWYACLFGDDSYADATIGRFSVNSEEDLRNTLQKQLEYRAQESPAPWQNTLGFIADHSEFEDAINRVMKQAAPPRFFMERVMMSDLPWVDNFYFPKEIADAQQAKVSTEATRRIRDMFNNGAAVVTFFGHGSPNVWSSERMWFGGDSPNSDNKHLTNRDRLSIVINMTCNSGAIDYPQPSWNVNISEDFMRVDNGGAVACFVPSGPGLTVQHERLMMEIGPTLFSGEPRPLGESLQLALWRYLANQNSPDLAQMYILLGDPLLLPQLATPGAPADAGPSTIQSSDFIMLPPAPAGTKRHVQAKSYGDGVEPSDIRELPENARLLRLEPDDLDGGGLLAVATIPAEGSTTLAQSYFLPANVLDGLRVTRWLRLDDPTVDDSRATVEFTISNELSTPADSVTVQFHNDRCSTCPAVISGPHSIPSMSNVTSTVELELLPGLNYYNASITADGHQADARIEPPIVFAGIRRDGDAAQAYPPAVIDPESVLVRYRHGADKTTRANLTFRLHILSPDGVANMSLGLARPDGTLIPTATTTVADGRPGTSTNVSMSLEIPAGTTSSTYSVQFDPKGLHPEFRQFPSPTITLGSDHFPDIAITSITSPDPSPVDGGTIFFDVALANIGNTAADGVKVEGERLLSDGSTELLKSQVQLRRPLLTLDPGATETIRLRWDPFNNAGNNIVRFNASSSYQTPDRNPANNVVEFTVPVRSKARIQKGTIAVLPLTDEERQQRQIRIAADIRNTGESSAQGLQVRFYATPEMNPSDLLGTADIDVIQPGETHQAVLNYKLKPGEENRQFRFSYEVLYRGARQRVPVDTTDE